jgi:hypothetical protein
VRTRAYMLSCPARADVGARTMERLAATDWAEPPALALDETVVARRQERQLLTARSLLARAVEEDGDADRLLFLEDDLDFNSHLRHNLAAWPPVRSLAPGGALFGSLYNPGLGGRPVEAAGTCLEVDPGAVYGSQAFVLSAATARYLVEHWHEVEGMQDIKMSRLAGRLGPVLYHSPSLVQHVGMESTWGGHAHVALDFDAEWRSPEAPSASPAVSSQRARRKAIVTLGAGAHAGMLSVTLPTFEAYAERHGYDLVVGTGEEAAGRPPPWAKVPLLRRTLAQYELALWLDADAAVVDVGADIAEALETWAFQALVEHCTPQGRCPNTGVWLLRAGSRSTAFLDAVWGATELEQHPWWENAAVCDALGYDTDPPCRRTRYTEFASGTQWLSTAWNSIPHNRPERPRIVHLAGEPIDERAAALAIAVGARGAPLAPPPTPDGALELALDRMRPVPGWFEEDEARVLFNAALRVGPGGTIVEVGSTWGRSTVVLATAAAAIGARVVAIDPHDGVVSAVDDGVMRFEPTWETFLATLATCGVDAVVTPIRGRSVETQWRDPIDLLFVDGMHDHESVAADTEHFMPWIPSGGQLAFHDYGAHFPGVQRNVNGLLAGPHATLVDAAGALVVLERLA